MSRGVSLETPVNHKDGEAAELLGLGLECFVYVLKRPSKRELKRGDETGVFKTAAAVAKRLTFALGAK